MARPLTKTKPISNKKSKAVDWADVLLTQILDDKAIVDSNWYREPLPVPVREHKFHHIRRWRFDLAFLKERLAIEIEGAVWIMGRHTRGSGFVKDMEKYNEATFLDWKLLRFTPNDVRTGNAIKFLNKYFRGEEHD